MAYEWIVQNYPEPNLLAENIKKDVEIFGVEWDYIWEWPISAWSWDDIVVWTYRLKYKIFWNMILIWYAWTWNSLWPRYWIVNDELTRNKIADVLWFTTVESNVLTKNANTSSSTSCSIYWDWSSWQLWSTWGEWVDMIYVLFVS